MTKTQVFNRSALMVMLLTSAAQAAETTGYPNKPIRMLIGFPQVAVLILRRAL
jgi:hypothetical protein